MSIQETIDHFYKGIINHFNNIGDTENAKDCEEFYQKLKVQRQGLDEDNKRIINELTK
ncbi:hypothetical protein [Bacillus thuringiensis]|uniref:hypothetical protein n=1 Tax=Bacillus thuringiensis TaxID=1428 RepID=UPI0028695B28|nr:hypothetical protein [Bacillus thuringiensis]